MTLIPTMNLRWLEYNAGQAIAAMHPSGTLVSENGTCRVLQQLFHDKFGKEIWKDISIEESL